MCVVENFCRQTSGLRGCCLYSSSFCDEANGALLSHSHLNLVPSEFSLRKCTPRSATWAKKTPAKKERDGILGGCGRKYRAGFTLEQVEGGLVMLWDERQCYECWEARHVLA